MKFILSIVVGVLLANGVVFAKGRVLSIYHVENPTRELIRTLFEKYDFDRKGPKGYEVVVPAGEIDSFLKLVPDARLIERDMQDVFRRLDNSHPKWRGNYRSNDSVTKELRQIARDFPSIATLENYGTTDEGFENLVLKVTGKTHIFTAKPELMLTSATHGNELITVEIMMNFIQKMVKGYGKEARITDMIDKHIIYFIPVVSPDGYAHYSREANGVDPNRNYPYPGLPDRESIALIKNEIEWFAKHRIVGSLDVHSNLETVMYPWAYTDERPSVADVSRFTEIGRVMARDTGYNFGQISDVFGIARGSSADYWYWKAKTLAFGFEVGDSFIDPMGYKTNSRGDEEAFMHFIEFF